MGRCGGGGTRFVGEKVVRRWVGSWYVGARIGRWCVEVGGGSEGARVHGAVHQDALGETDLCRLKNAAVFFRRSNFGSSASRFEPSLASF